MLRVILPALLGVSFALLLSLPPTELAARQRFPSLTFETVNDAAWETRGKSSTPLVVKLQVLLDRASASPGEIDGTLGENTRKAIAAYAELKGLEPTAQITEELWRAITESDAEPALLSYKITEKDTRGPFYKKIPRRWTGLAIRARGSFSPRSST